MPCGDMSTTTPEPQEIIFDADGSELLGWDTNEEDWFPVYYCDGDFTDGDEAYCITHWKSLTPPQGE